MVKVAGLTFPCDLAGSEPLHRLYIGDSQKDCIWCLNAADGETLFCIQDVHWPCQLSVTKTGCIVTVDDYQLLKVKNQTIS